MTPMFTKRPIPIGTYEGRGALWSFNGYSRWVPYCAPFNHTGQPAASVPAGFTADGFPLAVQLVGRPGDEATLLSLAAQIEAERPWADRVPAALIELAEEIARAAGAQLRAAFETELRIETKSSPTDLVSEADVAAEKLIRERLLAARPADGMLGEEGSDTRRHERAALDRRPARRHHELPVRHPAVGRLDRGRGRGGHARRRRLRPDARRAVGRRAAASAPTLDGEPLDGREHASELATALVATGFGYEADVRAAQAEITGRLLPLVRDIRRMGSAAIDLAWTAAGRYDAYFERGIKTWDYAAGALICEAAGLEVRHLNPAPPMDAGILVAPRRARGRARLAGRLIRARPGYPPRHGHRRRHRLLHPAPHPRVPVPAPLAASRARRPEGDEHRIARSEQGARQARPVVLEAVQHVEQGHLEVRQRRPARPQQGRLRRGVRGAAPSGGDGAAQPHQLATGWPVASSPARSSRSFSR